ncbi:MAG: efflux RND transporter permease subunit [Alphaproteobacteria bacterium]
MNISELCIRRPVFATVLSLIVILVGLVSYTRLTVREYPKIDPPVVTVTTVYRGASAEIIESQVTQALEEVLAGIEGIDFITSVSRQDQSQITATFTLDRDPSSAAADVRDRVSRARRNLPDEVDEPIIEKVEADAQPTIYIAFWSDRHSSMEITDYADRYVKDQLQTIPGAAQVRIFGERRYSMRIWLDPDRLAAYRLTPQDIEAALRRENVEVPAGLVESRYREFTVLSETDLKLPQQFNDMVIKKTAQGYLVRLIDVGHAELGPLDERRIVRFNGESAVALGVIKQATANPLDVADAVYKKIPAIVDGLPQGMVAKVAYDRSKFIAESIKNVYQTILEAVGLVVLIIFAFLRSIRATLIPLVTIPISLIGAFALMELFGFSINTLTLLAMVLAIGLVVDDAIVMLENIYRHVEEGKSPFRAAIDGAREITFAVVAMTLTLAAVYLPVAFQGGTTGKLFTEFALTLAGAVLVSGFVALTASPMMCSLFLKRNEKHGLIFRATERFLNGITAGYRRSLRWSLKVRPLVLLVGIGVAAGGYFFFTQLKEELAPYEDQGTIVGFYFGPEGSTIDFTDIYARQIEEILATVPEIERYFVVSGFPVVNKGIAFAGLKPWGERERTQQEIGASIAPRFFGIPGIMAFPINPPPLGQSVRNKPVGFVIQTTQPYEKLQEMSNAFMDKLRENPALVNLESDLVLNKPQLKIDVDRARAADMGVPAEVLGRTLETLLGGRQVTRFKRDGQQYDVVVKVADPYRTSPSDLPKLYVRGGDGRLIQLANLVTVSETVAPRELNHFNQLRAATITANLAPGYALGEVLEFMAKTADEVLPPGTTRDYTGESREFRVSSESIYFTLVLSLAFIYLVLAAQFESFRSPFIIMLTVPLSIAGGLGALWLDGSTLNIYSKVGIVTLIGLITKHGILIVEFANQRHEAGASLTDAVIEAAGLRLRPILMTTGAMVFGAVPLAVASGAGAMSRQDIGLVIVGGILVGTLFTLYVIPAVYTYVASRKRIADRGRESPQAQPAE